MGTPLTAYCLLSEQTFHLENTWTDDTTDKQRYILPHVHWAERTQKSLHILLTADFFIHQKRIWFVIYKQQCCDCKCVRPVSQLRAMRAITVRAQKRTHFTETKITNWTAKLGLSKLGGWFVNLCGSVESHLWSTRLGHKNSFWSILAFLCHSSFMYINRKITNEQWGILVRASTYHVQKKPAPIKMAWMVLVSGPSFCRHVYSF